jgi:hypothetical protein
MRTALLLDATVNAIADNRIYASPVVPSDIELPAVSMYLTTVTDGGLEYGNFPNTVNCFADSYNDAEDLQDAVFQALNRSSGENETFFTCGKQIIIPPSNTGGEYNAPVEVLTRQR